MAPIVHGGLNIVDFETECSSLRLSSLAGYQEGLGTCKWHFLARYFFGNRFSNLDPSFDFSSLTIPLSSKPSAFYRNCLSLLSFFCIVNTALYWLIFLVKICIVFF